MGREKRKTESEEEDEEVAMITTSQSDKNINDGSISAATTNLSTTECSQ
jgi:hypothetical protein